MITLEEDKIQVDLRELSHTKSFKDLCKDETEAFRYGLYYPRVITYLQNANIKKKNPTLYKEINNINIDTINYIEPMFKLIDEYIDDGNESFLGVTNYILENLEYKNNEDKLKMAFVLGVYLISGRLAQIIKSKLEDKDNLKKDGE